MTDIAANTGRRYRAVPHASDTRASVRMIVQSPQGRPLPTVSDGFDADDAIALGLALLAAGRAAKAQRADLRAGVRP